MRAMEIPEDFIQMVMGLVTGGQSKLHVNGVFTKEFKLERGVRQGCPISPMLFAISSQPLMTLLRIEEMAGRLKGVSIPRGGSFLHRFFADDSGVMITAEERYFGVLQTTVEKYEQISGAKLNLPKSVVLPLALPDIHSGSNKQAIPIYQLLSIVLRNDGYKQLESVCRNFLWGSNPEGRTKTTLISWQFVTQKKRRGGFGFTSFSVTADTLKIRFVSKLMQGDKAEWAQALRFFLTQEMQKRSHTLGCRDWTPEEGLLLMRNFSLKDSPTAKHFIKAWL
ncbi:hypothetical protein R1sor_004200 [Riccia sorocarpa]|uniref:Reverse transcriptase domain-containing protein n=1 Tax=Riccia sorocarpa TaxID=122646 RepID=A0ABD3H3U2_9MARC